jgi:UDP-glucose/iron transport system permease protein
MLKHFFTSHIALGFAQAGIAAAMALVILFLARRRQIHLESEIVISLVRGIAQISAMGFILVLLLKGPQWTSVIMLSIMMLAAASISSRRVRAIPGAYEISLYGIVTGAGIVITLMTIAGVIDWAITSLIPVGSMLIANSMNSNSLALERFRSEVTGNVGQIEAALSLGASANNTVNPYVQNAFRASLIPALDNLKSLGIVWIPGLMAGMLLSGSPPIYAAIYQFVVISMIFSASAITCLVSTTLVRKRSFSPQEQLVLRPVTVAGRSR